ncbi:MAG TPA: flagellin [Verrucomicrobiales bacterium]|nr:flagellin [Verrucomicrobiales bacterium]HAH98543.1 flagellin [Verrucomicrobiales bacterium]
MVINTNTAAMASARSLAWSTTQLGKSLARLSSGSKIVSPEDDAAGLAQSMRFEAQINRNSAVKSNLGNAVSFTQTQDGFLQKVQASLDRMSELSVLAQDITKTNTDRSNYNVEFEQLQNYISDIGQKTYNSVSLFAATGETVTIDSNAASFAMAAIDMATSGIGIGLEEIYNSSTSAINTSTSAATALLNIQTAIQALADMRANVGANIQRLNMTDDQVTILNENLSAANSRIKDIDVAQEATEFARYNILVQSGTAMLGQANMLPSMALQLIG